MMSFNVDAAQEILKKIYLGPIRNQLNQSTPYLAQVARNTEDVRGLEAVIPLRTGRSEAHGARADGGALPTAQHQRYKKSRIDVVFNYGRIQVTGPTIAKTSTDRGAFLRAVDSEMKGQLTDLKEDYNRQVLRNDSEGSGKLAQVTNAETGTTLEIADATRVTFRILRPNQRVDIFSDYTDDPTLIADNVEIVSTDPDAGTITISSALTSGADTDTHIFRHGSEGNEVVGLEGIVSDEGTLQQVDPDDFPVWKSHVLDNDGTERALSEDLLQNLVDEVDAESGEEPDAFLVEYAQRRRFNALLQAQKRAVNTLELKGGFKALTFNDNIPFLVERFADPNTVYALSWKHLAIYEASDWDWMDKDGAVLQRVADRDAYEATLFKYDNQGTDRRNALGKLVDLAA